MKSITLLLGLMIILSGCEGSNGRAAIEEFMENNCAEEIKPYTNESVKLFIPSTGKGIHKCCWNELRFNESTGYSSETICRGFKGSGIIK